MHTGFKVAGGNVSTQPVCIALDLSWLTIDLYGGGDLPAVGLPDDALISLPLKSQIDRGA